MCQFELAWQPWQYTQWGQNNFEILTLKQFHEILSETLSRKFIVEKLKIHKASHQIVDVQKFEY